MSKYIAKRGNPQGFLSETKTVEELYFHTGNSGITARMLETKRFSPDRSIVDHVGYRMEFVHGAQGHSSTMSTPILSPSMVDNYISMLQRLRMRMDMEEAYSPERDFEEDRVVQVMNGYKIDAVYSPQIVTGRYSTSRFLLGYTYTREGEEPIFKRQHGSPKAQDDCAGSPACEDDDGGKYMPSELGRVMADLDVVLYDHSHRQRVFRVDVSEEIITKVRGMIEEISKEIAEARVFHYR